MCTDTYAHTLVLGNTAIKCQWSRVPCARVDSTEFSIGSRNAALLLGQEISTAMQVETTG